MKCYIRYFEEKSFWNIFLRGKVFFLKRKYGIYLSKENSELYLRCFDSKVKNVFVMDRRTNLQVDTDGKDYVCIEPFHYILISYQDGSAKKIHYISDEYGQYLKEF